MKDETVKKITAFLAVYKEHTDGSETKISPNKSVSIDDAIAFLEKIKAENEI